MSDVIEPVKKVKQEEVIVKKDEKRKVRTKDA